jgi:hypothetical protein
VDDRADRSADDSASKNLLLNRLRATLQQRLDALLEEVEPTVGRWRRPNPMWTGAAD